MIGISDTVWQLKNRQILIDEAKNDQLVEFYTPPTKHEIPLDGYIFEMRLDIRIRSISEMPRIPVTSNLLTEREKDDLYWETVKDVPAKLINFFSSTASDPEPLYRFGILLFNINPSYSEEIVGGWTNQQTLSVAFGSRLYYKIGNYNSGSFGADDKVTLFLSATEQANIITSTFGTAGIPGTLIVEGSPIVCAELNNRRAYLTITNRGNHYCFLSTSTPVPGAGKSLAPNNSFEINKSNYTNKQILAICYPGESTILDIEEQIF